MREVYDYRGVDIGVFEETWASMAVLLCFFWYYKVQVGSVSSFWAGRREMESCCLKLSIRVIEVM